jgi:hypothetical protein
MGIRGLGLAMLFAGLVNCSFGATITDGFFNIAGTIYVTNPESTAVVTPAGTCPANQACIFWQDSAGVNPEEADISADGLPNGNIPLAIAGNDAANIFNLNQSTEPVGTTFAPTSFMTFNNGGITTDLLINLIYPGFYPSTECSLPAAVGQVCTLPGSLFNFVNNPPAIGQATATWVFQGITDTPGVTWVGNFNSQFPGNTPFQTVFQNLATNGYVSNTFSATITLIAEATTPEPGTMEFTMIGAGFICLAVLLRRRSAKEPALICVAGWVLPRTRN